MLQDQIGGVVHSSCQVLHGAFTEFIYSEDLIVPVGDAVDGVLEDVDAEWMIKLWKKQKPTNRS